MLNVRQISSDIVDIVHNIQKKSFEPLLNKYHDYDVNPAMESAKRIREKIDRDNTTAYIFQLNDINVGWVRVMELGDMIYKISTLDCQYFIIQILFGHLSFIFFWCHIV